jgi:hypothetical protein
MDEIHKVLLTEKISIENRGTLFPMHYFHEVTRLAVSGSRRISSPGLRWSNLLQRYPYCARKNLVLERAPRHQLFEVRIILKALRDEKYSVLKNSIAREKIMMLLTEFRKTINFIAFSHSDSILPIPSRLSRGL